MTAGKKIPMDSRVEEAKTEFISIISHHLRTPIASVRWSLDALRNGQFGALNVQQKKALDEAYQHNKHLAKVISDLLRISWLEENGTNSKPKLLKLNPLVHAVLSRYASFAKAYNVTIRLQEKSVMAYVDPVQFEWLCGALIHNAILYSRRDGTVSIQISKRDSWAVLQIRDNGIGISKQDQKKVFTKFFRAANARKLHPDGLGLDLYVIRRMVESIGGSMAIQSKENNFTHCVVLLPTQKPKKLLIPIQKNEAADVLQKERQFVAVTVHELRSPLARAKWSLDALRSGRPGPLTSEQHQLINQLYDGTERLLVLVRDMLNMSKLQQGNFEIKPVKANFLRIIKNTKVDFTQEAATAGVRLKFAVSTVPLVLCDPIRITQALYNIVSNAIKYTKRGGEVKISTRIIKTNTKVHLATNPLVKKNSKGYVLVSVQDSGVGIPKADCDKIFTPFFRSKKAMASGTGGTGLGLYIAKSIIDMHGGTIWFESVPAKGSIFYFTVPLA